MLLHVPLLQSINGLSALILHICYILMLLHVPILQSIDGLSALILLQIHICYILMLLHVPILQYYNLSNGLSALILELFSFKLRMLHDTGLLTHHDTLIMRFRCKL